MFVHWFVFTDIVAAVKTPPTHHSPGEQTTADTPPTADQAAGVCVCVCVCVRVCVCACMHACIQAPANVSHFGMCQRRVTIQSMATFTMLQKLLELHHLPIRILCLPTL